MIRCAYQAVTDRIVAALEQGVVPWRKPWQDTPLPINAVSGRTYRGVNLFLLSILPYTDHRWLTYKQAQELGGHVKRGSQASLVVFWKRWAVPEVEEAEAQNRRRIIPLLRFYHVFNAEQCEGLSIDPLEGARLAEEDRIEQAEEVVRSMPNPPRIREMGDAAWYRPGDDLVQVPPVTRFETADAFYATLFHELAHSTGHASRIGRSGISDQVPFGSMNYSREELIAELGSAYCCSGLGLDNSLIGQSASYVEGWLKALKDDPKALTIAAAQAQRAADYIRGLIEGPDEVLYKRPA